MSYGDIMPSLMSLPPRLDLSRRFVSPTDVSQYLTLSRCERFLRLRLYQNENGVGFLKNFGVNSVPIPPLLTETGQDFEENLAQKFKPAIDCKKEAIEINGKRQPDNNRLLEVATNLAPSKICYFLQPRLVAHLGNWEVRGEADLVQFRRDSEHQLHIFVLDFKSSSKVKVEHKLQVAFYKAMLATIFPDTSIRTGVQCAAGLEKIADQAIYDAEVVALVTGGNSSAERIATLPFDDLFFALNSRCDGCHYHEFCFKDAHETGDLSLLPHLSPREKKAFRGVGLRTVDDLACLTNPDTLATLAQTPVGAYQAEWVARAKKQSDGYARPAPTLPFVSETFHPNLIMIYFDAQEDYVDKRLWFLAAKVERYESRSPTAPCAPMRTNLILSRSSCPPCCKFLQRVAPKMLPST
jgi:predicted RecB family nuclease